MLFVTLNLYVNPIYKFDTVSDLEEFLVVDNDFR